MPNRPGSLLVTLGKRMLGFNTSSTGCCAPTTRDGDKAAVGDDAVALPSPEAQGHAGSCCAASATTTAKGAGVPPNSRPDSPAHK